jgi:hypothetical protein
MSVVERQPQRSTGRDAAQTGAQAVPAPELQSKDIGRVMVEHDARADNCAYASRREDQRVSLRPRNGVVDLGRVCTRQRPGKDRRHVQ